MDDKEMVYRAMCSHGGTHLLVADIPVMREEVAESVARAIIKGMKVDRVTVEEARKAGFGCEECDRKAGR